MSLLPAPCTDFEKCQIPQEVLPFKSYGGDCCIAQGHFVGLEKGPIIR